MSPETISCLIVDDHPTVRRGVAAILAAEDDIELAGEATDGSAALRLVEQRRPTVCVADARMDGLDGLQLCQAVVAAGLPTQVVLYTGFEDIEVLVEALEVGAMGFVVKCGPVEDLVRAVRFAAQGRVYIDASLGAALVARQAPPPDLLSPREEQVVRALASGRTTSETAGDLFLSPATVRSYTESAMGKLNARNRVHAVAQTLRMGIID